MSLWSESLWSTKGDECTTVSEQAISGIQRIQPGRGTRLAPAPGQSRAQNCLKKLRPGRDCVSKTMAHKVLMEGDWIEMEGEGNREAQLHLSMVAVALTIGFSGAFRGEENSKVD